jgi:hypothetical protein
MLEPVMTDGEKLDRLLEGFVEFVKDFETFKEEVLEKLDNLSKPGTDWDQEG